MSRRRSCLTGMLAATPDRRGVVSDLLSGTIGISSDYQASMHTK